MASVSAVALDGAGAGVEQRQLAEHLALAHDREQRLAAVGGGVPELDLAVGDDVQPVPGVALGEQDVPAEQPALLHGRLQGSGCLGVQRGEQRRAHEHVVHGGLLASCGAAAAYGRAARRSRGHCDVRRCRVPHPLPVGRRAGAGPTRNYPARCDHQRQRDEPPGGRAQRPPRTRRRGDPTALVRRARRMERILGETYPDAHCELDFTTPLELLGRDDPVARSAPTCGSTWSRPTLFARYPDAAAYAGADRAELEELIRSTGFFRNKTSSIIGLGQALCETVRRRGAPAGWPTW